MASGGSVHFSIQKLNSDNYSVWSYKVELLLTKEKLWDVIKYEKPEPVTTAWSQKDDEARATVYWQRTTNYSIFGMRKVP